MSDHAARAESGHATPQDPFRTMALEVSPDEVLQMAWNLKVGVDWGCHRQALQVQRVLA